MVKKGRIFTYLGIALCIGFAVATKRERGASGGRDREVAAAQRVRVAEGFAEGTRRRVRNADRAGQPRVTAEQIGRALRSEREEEREIALGTWLPELTERAPAGAAEMVTGLEPWAWRERALQAVARAWAERDPEAAASWARSLAGPAERDLLVSSICRQVVLQDPAKAVELAGQGASPELLGMLVELWARGDFAPAADWVERLPAGPAREAFYARLAMGRAQDFPAEAAKLVAERMVAGELQEEAAISIVHRWGITDTAAATAWVERFPAGDLQARARDELAGIELYRQLAPR